MDIGDKVRYIGGQDEEGEKQFKLDPKAFYTVAHMQPEQFTYLGICMAVRLEEVNGDPTPVFRQDLFVVIPLMKKQSMRAYMNYCTDEEREIGKRNPIEDLIKKT